MGEPTILSTNSGPGANSPGGGDDEWATEDQSGCMLLGDGADLPSRAKWGPQGWCRPSCIFIGVILILMVAVVLLPLLGPARDKDSSNTTDSRNDSELTCSNSCELSLVETIPIGIIYPNDSVSHQSTYHSWMELIALAQSSIEIVAYKWTLTRQDSYAANTPQNGEAVLTALLEAGRDRGVRLRIVQRYPPESSSDYGLNYLSEEANAEVRSIDFADLSRRGLLHIKLWIIDRTHIYIGSANMDWRALMHNKELGLVAVNCSCLANDAAKIFDLYWKLSDDGKIPTTWPESLATKINVDNPLNFTSDNNKYRAFFSASPPQLSSNVRTKDLDAILHCIRGAKKFIHIAVTNYSPLIIDTPKQKYWPIIDDALRSAAIDHSVHIRLLVSSRRSPPFMRFFLKSLAALTESFKDVKIEVKMFTVPTNSEFDKIPLARLIHDKYMVTDIAAFIGSSNWYGDYFISTADIGVVLEYAGHTNEGNTSIRQQLDDIFLRDWNSPYAHPLTEVYPDEKTP